MNDCSQTNMETELLFKEVRIKKIGGKSLERSSVI